MPISVRLDEEMKALLSRTALVLKKTKTEILKASIREFCTRSMEERAKRPYDLIKDLIGKESSGQGNLAMDSEQILRKAFRKKQ
jgi:RHH-type transcriptional regulator, rel operon repressor / antitoxin RelB